MNKTERTLRQFIEVFPDRCITCAIHRYGLSYGFVTDPEPPPHECVEDARSYLVAQGYDVDKDLVEFKQRFKEMVERNK